MKTIIVAFILGFVGAILFAPKSGADLRQAFWDKIDEVESDLDKELESRGLL